MTTEEGREKVNISYDCAESGHLMSSWKVKTGIPKATYSRACVVLNCQYVEVMEAPKV